MPLSSRTGRPPAAPAHLAPQLSERPRHVDPLLLNVREVATLLNCSPRHVYRLCDSGRMPAPRKLGNLVRWDRTQILEWIAQGCPAIRGFTRRGGLR